MKYAVPFLIVYLLFISSGFNVSGSNPGLFKEAVASQASHSYYFDSEKGYDNQKQCNINNPFQTLAQQTLLDLFGNGEATLFVNGNKYRPIHLDGSKATVPDIDLHQFWNSILIYYVPEKSSGLKILWHDRENRPEIEFQFE